MSDTELLDNPLQPLLDALEDRFGEQASPLPNETDAAWYARMQTTYAPNGAPLLSPWSRPELKDARNVVAMRAAEAAGSVVDIQEADYFEPEPLPDGPQGQAARTRQAKEAPWREPVAESLRTLKPE